MKLSFVFSLALAGCTGIKDPTSAARIVNNEVSDALDRATQQLVQDIRTDALAGQATCTQADHDALVACRRAANDNALAHYHKRASDLSTAILAQHELADALQAVDACRLTHDTTCEASALEAVDRAAPALKAVVQSLESTLK